MTKRTLIKTDFKQDEIDCAIRVLKSFSKNSEQLTLLLESQRVDLLTAAGRLSRPNRQEIKARQKDVKKLRKQKQRLANIEVRKTSGIRQARESQLFSAPAQITNQLKKNVNEENKNPTTVEKNKTSHEYVSAHNCYVCKAEFKKIHHFYDSMCNQCAELNYLKRYQSADLTGQVALITGSRVKIGFQATLLLLRAGARVIATTRFPIDSARRFSNEPGFKNWGSRLQIYGLDLRHTPSVEIFAKFIEKKYDRLDLLINNAAQTVRRPSGFYAHLMAGEEEQQINNLPKQASHLLSEHLDCVTSILSSNHLSNPTQDHNKNIPVAWHTSSLGVGIRSSAKLSQIPYSFDSAIKTQEVFPVNNLDCDLQQVDLRKTNSWRLRLGEIEAPEMLEVHLVNAVAPFVLINRLIGLMRKENTGKKHIVNVTAMEGKFHRFTKADRHPHTNMAKAALNMMTHTSASDFAKDGIFMNAVDTGWVTDEDPILLSKKKQDMHDFQPPLDIVDGAARICDPFFDGINTKKHWSGKFLKDYFPIDW